MRSLTTLGVYKGRLDCNAIKTLGKHSFNNLPQDAEKAMSS